MKYDINEDQAVSHGFVYLTVVQSVGKSEPAWSSKTGFLQGKFTSAIDCVTTSFLTFSVWNAGHDVQQVSKHGLRPAYSSKVLDEGEARSDEEWVVVSTADSYRYHVRLEAKA